MPAWSAGEVLGVHLSMNSRNCSTTSSSCSRRPRRPPRRCSRPRRAPPPRRRSACPVRAARAMASDGRLETRWPPSAGVQLDLGEEGAVPQVGDHDATRRSTPRSSSRSCSRSWVIGRGVGDLLEGEGDGRGLGPPMKIGRTRWSPVALPQQHDRACWWAARPGRRRAPSRPRSAPYRRADQSSPAYSSITCRSGSAARARPSAPPRARRGCGSGPAKSRP